MTFIFLEYFWNIREFQMHFSVTFLSKFCCVRWLSRNFLRPKSVFSHSLNVGLHAKVWQIFAALTWRRWPRPRGAQLRPPPVLTTPITAVCMSVVLVSSLGTCFYQDAACFFCSALLRRYLELRAARPGWPMALGRHEASGARCV